MEDEVMIKKREEKKNQKGKPQIFIVGGEIKASMMALTRTLKNVSKRKRKKAGQIDTDLDVFGDLIRRANADDSSLIVK